MLFGFGEGNEDFVQIYYLKTRRSIGKSYRDRFLIPIGMIWIKDYNFMQTIALLFNLLYTNNCFGKGVYKYSYIERFDSRRQIIFQCDASV